MSIIALDMGDKKIGVAISYSNVASRGLKTIDANNWREIIDLINELKVSRVVYGLPLKKNQAYSQQAKKIKEQIKSIKHELEGNDIKIQFDAVDETLSTQTAEQHLTKQKDQEKIHILSAQILLDQYLSELNSR